MTSPNIWYNDGVVARHSTIFGTDSANNLFYESRYKQNWYLQQAHSSSNVAD